MVVYTPISMSLGSDKDPPFEANQNEAALTVKAAGLGPKTLDLLPDRLAHWIDFLPPDK